MNKTARFLTIAAVLGVLLPTNAYAHAGWWDFLEAMSGPGPFGNGFVVDFRPWCMVREETAAPPSDPAQAPERRTAIWSGGTAAMDCLTNSNQVRGYFELRGGRVSTKSKPLFDDAPGELVGSIAANEFQAFFMRQIDPTIAVGVGAGLLWFSGDVLDRNPRRLVFTPVSVAFSPLKLFWRNSTKAGFVLVRFEEVAIVGGLKATDFNSRSSSAFDVKSDLVRSVSITFDAFTLIRGSR